MKVICSSCHRNLPGSEPPEDEPVSRGECDACFDHFVLHWTGQSFSQYLDDTVRLELSP